MKSFGVIILLFLLGCVEVDAPIQKPTGEFLFKDKLELSEVATLKSVARWQEGFSARLAGPRQSEVEIYVFKNPEFDTYFRDGKGYRFAIMLLVVEGELRTAAYTSTGDTKKVAQRTVLVDGVKTKKPSRGIESPEGTFSVDSVQRFRKSNAFGDALMNHAVFFYSGVAIHETFRENYGKLGRPASMGCIRLNESAASSVFETIKEYADRNSKDQIVGFSKVTVNIKKKGALELFDQEDIHNALKQNFRDEAKLRNRQ